MKLFQPSNELKYGSFVLYRNKKMEFVQFWLGIV
jgi:hypothetical protein